MKGTQRLDSLQWERSMPQDNNENELQYAHLKRQAFSYTATSERSSERQPSKCWRGEIPTNPPLTFTHKHISHCGSQYIPMVHIHLLPAGGWDRILRVRLLLCSPGASRSTIPTFALPQGRFEREKETVLYAETQRRLAVPNKAAPAGWQ